MTVPLAGKSSRLSGRTRQLTRKGGCSSQLVPRELQCHASDQRGALCERTAEAPRCQLAARPSEPLNSSVEIKGHRRRGRPAHDLAELILGATIRPDTTRHRIRLETERRPDSVPEHGWERLRRRAGLPVNPARLAPWTEHRGAS
jgi:hypothetical protein